MSETGFQFVILNKIARTAHVLLSESSSQQTNNNMLSEKILRWAMTSQKQTK